ncbi:putative acid phosphatase [Termitomyces sp. J132]|nr:putative acid phosphatase [Termitomyces sp. J132]
MLHIYLYDDDQKPINVYLADLETLAAKGLTLTNYYVLTHPSEPKYVASAGDDYFGFNSDHTISFPPNVSTIVDLLTKRFKIPRDSNEVPDIRDIYDYHNLQKYVNY